MDMAPLSIAAFVIIFLVAIGWATGGMTGSKETATPEEQVGKTS
jgi:hypothetical protein